MAIWTVFLRWGVTRDVFGGRCYRWQMTSSNQKSVATDVDLVKSLFALSMWLHYKGSKDWRWNHQELGTEESTRNGGLLLPNGRQFLMVAIRKPFNSTRTNIMSWRRIAGWYLGVWIPWRYIKAAILIINKLVQVDYYGRINRSVSLVNIWKNGKGHRYFAILCSPEYAETKIEGVSELVISTKTIACEDYYQLRSEMEVSPKYWNLLVQPSTKMTSAKGWICKRRLPTLKQLWAAHEKNEPRLAVP